MVQTAEEREAQKQYWKEHSSEATVEAMMLDSKASVIDKEERPEVSGTCPAHLWQALHWEIAPLHVGTVQSTRPGMHRTACACLANASNPYVQSIGCH